VKRTCLLLLVASVACGGQLPGTIRRSVKLSAKGGPYSVAGDVLISKGATIAVGEGAVLNLSSVADIEGQGRIVFVGTKEKPVIVNGGGMDVHVTAKGTKFVQCTIEPNRSCTDILGFKNCYFDGGSLYFGYDSRKSVVSECAFNGTRVYSYGSSYSYSYYSSTPPRIEGSTFTHCSIELETIAYASRCVFVNCTFTSSSSIYLPKDTGVTSCYFDTSSLANVLQAARGAQYRKGRLFVKQGKKPKKMPRVPGEGLGSGLGSGLGEP